jgi:hypothetical protein
MRPKYTTQGTQPNASFIRRNLLYKEMLKIQSRIKYLKQADSAVKEADARYYSTMNNQQFKIKMMSKCYQTLDNYPNYLTQKVAKA